MGKLRIHVTQRQECLNAVNLELKKVEDNLNDNSISISQLKSLNPDLQQRFNMFQEMKTFVRDLFECLNEKVILFLFFFLILCFRQSK